MFWLKRNRRSHMQRRYITVDVFTDRAFGGNPLAVILDAGGLSTAQMQAIASEFNYSETTFVLPPQDPTHDAQVRIFTVKYEIPFAGHPNVGTAFVLATQTPKPPARLKFEEKAGLVPVEVASRDALRRARPVASAFARTFPCDGSDAVYFYTRDVPPAEACDLQARMFHPGSSGLSEDPATGSATVAAAALLADLASERDGELKLRIGHGVDMNRRSLLLTRVVKQNGAIVSAHVGGACVQMMEGTFRLAGEG